MSPVENCRRSFCGGGNHRQFIISSSDAQLAISISFCSSCDDVTDVTSKLDAEVDDDDVSSLFVSSDEDILKLKFSIGSSPSERKCIAPMR